MNDQTTLRWGFSQKSIVYCILAIAHASLVFWLWFAAFILDDQIVNARYWLVIAWGWFGWLLVLVPRVRREPKLVVPTMLICAGLFVPCVSAIYSFTIWAVGRFTS